MSRDDVINTSDADHMILVYHLQPHDKPFKFHHVKNVEILTKNIILTI